MNAFFEVGHEIIKGLGRNVAKNSLETFDEFKSNYYRNIHNEYFATNDQTLGQIV